MRNSMIQGGSLKTEEKISITLAGRSEAVKILRKFLLSPIEHQTMMLLEKLVPLTGKPKAKA